MTHGVEEEIPGWRGVSAGGEEGTTGRTGEESSSLLGQTVTVGRKKGVEGTVCCF